MIYIFLSGHGECAVGGCGLFDTASKFTGASNAYARNKVASGPIYDISLFKYIRRISISLNI